MAISPRPIFGDRRFALCYFALGPLYLAPLVATHFIPAFDLPHHLAIVDALTKTKFDDSPYARDFTVGLEFAPFVVHFVVLRALAAFMPINVAAKVLIGTVALALPLATARLLTVSGRDAVPAVLAYALVYSMPLHYGFIAFMVALPFLVWMLAEASNEIGWRERPLRQGFLLAVLAAATFFAHLEAWAIGVVAAAVVVLLGSAAWRTRVAALSSLMPSVLLCIVYIVRTGADPRFRSEPSFARAVVAVRLQELAGHGVIVDVWNRARGLPIHLLRGFTDGSDVVAARVFFLLIGVALLSRFARGVLGGPRASSRPTGAAGALAIALAAYFGLPHHVRHAVSIYPRFAVVVALLLLAIPDWLSNGSRRLKDVMAAAFVVSLALHSFDLVRHYAAFGRELADFEQVVDDAPPGLAAAGLVFDPESVVMNIEGIFTGIPAYYVIERRAPSSSTWLYYCADPQVPCQMRDPDRPPPIPFFSYPSQFDPRRALEAFELFFVRGGPSSEQIFGAEMPRVRLLAAHGTWRVFARRQ